MKRSGLEELAKTDERGQPYFRLVGNAVGELVLVHPDGPVPPGCAELEGRVRQRLATRARSGPGLVVENSAGNYVVLVDGSPDPERHVPVDLDDTSVLVEQPVAVFGQRANDQLVLTPWQADEPSVTFDPDDPAFADVPLVIVSEGTVKTIRSELPAHLIRAVHRQLYDLDAGTSTRYGVFANEFGEVLCIAEGEPVEAHNDVRYHGVLRARSLMDGARTLEEAAADLRAFADRLDAAAAAGWSLPAPIGDDLGFPQRERP